MEARTFVGAEAVSAGLADAVGVIEDVVSELAQLHGKATAKFDKYDKIERLYGKTDALHARLDDAHAAGVRVGIAAALRGERT
jgi:ClpP class serine protease